MLAGGKRARDACGASLAALVSDSRGRGEGRTRLWIGDEKRTKEQWLAVRKDAGLKIDPETAEVFWKYGQVCDPYGLYDLTDEGDCIGRNYFARSPGSNVWVWFDDLPDAVRDRLW